MRFWIFTTCGLLMIFSNPDYAQRSANSGLSPEISVVKRQGLFPFRKKATKEQKKLLQPKPADLNKHAQLLGRPGTGIFRLLPDSGCQENALVVRADETCLNAIPDSSFFSFREKEHAAELLADIRLKDDYLISDGVLSQAILVMLGDRALDQVSLETEGMRFLNDYAPSQFGREAQKQFLQMAKGVKVGGYEYRKALPAVENATYALRVVAYRASIVRSYRGFVYDLLGGDKRIDLTVAFRVVRREADGTVTLVWKELARKESPKLKFQKNREAVRAQR